MVYMVYIDHNPFYCDDYPLFILVRWESFAIVPTKRRFEHQNLAQTKKQAICFSLLLMYSYSRWESNPHSRRNWILNPARLPIPPLEQIGLQKYNFFLK